MWSVKFTEESQAVDVTLYVKERKVRSKYSLLKTEIRFYG